MRCSQYVFVLGLEAGTLTRESVAAERPCLLRPGGARSEHGWKFGMTYAARRAYHSLPWHPASVF